MGFALVAWSVAAVPPAAARDGSASLRGRVVDARRAALEGVRVTVRNRDTATTRAADTDAGGRYLFADLPAGTYDLVAELEPFPAVRREGLELGAGAEGTANITLALGGVRETIVVTADRRERRSVDVPMSVAALSQADIDRAGIDSLGDLSQAVPGLFVVDRAPGLNRILMRGISNSGDTPLTGVYVDEISVSGLPSGFQLDLQLVDLERVEVLRGPQGTLYGQNSAGGTVRFITRDPELDAVSAEVELEAGVTEHGDPSSRLTGVVNLPVVEETFGLRVSGTVAETGGWIDQPAAEREDINDQNLRNGRIKSLWKPIEALEVMGTVVVHRNGGDGINVGADERYDVAYPNGDPLARQRFVDDYDLYNATVRYDFGAATLLSSTSRMEVTKEFDGFAQKRPPRENFIRGAHGFETMSQELRLTPSASGRLSWVLGGYYADETLDDQVRVNNYASGVPTGTESSRSEQMSKSWSAFGDVSYELTDRLRLGAGARYFVDQRELEANERRLSGTFSSVDPRLHCTFALTPEVNLYASAAKGFRSGGFNPVFEPDRYGPEEIWSYELGAKGGGRSWTWEAAGFFSRYEEFQTTVRREDIVRQATDNAGDAESRGVDVLLAVEATRRLTVQLSGNVTEAELVSVLPSNIRKVAGDSLDLVPEYAASLSTEYRFDWRTEAPGYFRVDYNQVGPSTFTARNLGVIAVSSDTIRMLNGRLGVQLGRWGVELFGRNRLGENGRLDPLHYNGRESRPRPRTVGLALRASWWGQQSRP